MVPSQNAGYFGEEAGKICADMLVASGVIYFLLGVLCCSQLRYQIRRYALFLHILVHILEYYIHACSHNIYIYTYMYMHTPIHIHIHRQTNPHTYTQTRIHTRTYA